MSEEYIEGDRVVDVLSPKAITDLPSWVKADLQNARIVGESKNIAEISNGRRYSLGNIINDLDGVEWTRHIGSVINTRYSTVGVDSFAYKVRKIHPTPKPPQLMKDLIMFFTKEKEIVFDYFMGVGGSMLGASLCGRRGAGIELNPIYIEAYKKAAMELNLPVQPCLCGDCNALLESDKMMDILFREEKAGMILIDPPYANMMTKPKTGADMKKYGKNSTPFTNSQLDIGNLNKDQFISALKSIVEKSLHFLKKKGYLAIFCKDMQPKKKDINLLHADIINALNDIPLLYYRGLKIWVDQTAKLFPYGYPFDFVANQIHQYILIFRKY